MIPGAWTESDHHQTSKDGSMRSAARRQDDNWLTQEDKLQCLQEL